MLTGPDRLDLVQKKDASRTVSRRVASGNECCCPTKRETKNSSRRGGQNRATIKAEKNRMNKNGGEEELPRQVWAHGIAKKEGDHS